MKEKAELTREEFLARCGTIYDMGLAKRNTIQLMERWVDFVLRFEHTMFSHGQSQGRYAFDFLETERDRLRDTGTLAGDEEGYSIIKLVAVLTNPCQKCAEDKKAWHTRAAFCEHKRGDI